MSCNVIPALTISIVNATSRSNYNRDGWGQVIIKIWKSIMDHRIMYQEDLGKRICVGTKISMQKMRKKSFRIGTELSILKRSIMLLYSRPPDLRGKTYCFVIRNIYDTEMIIERSVKIIP